MVSEIMIFQGEHSLEFHEISSVWTLQIVAQPDSFLGFKDCCTEYGSGRKGHQHVKIDVHEAATMMNFSAAECFHSNPTSI